MRGVRTLLAAVLLAAPALAGPPGTADFVARNRDAWLARKKAPAPALDHQGRMAIGRDGDLISAFVEATNPVAAAGGERAKLRDALRALRAWAAARRETADRLAADAEALLEEALSWKGAVPPARAGLVSDGDDELSVASRQLAPPRGAPPAGAADAWAGVLRRWRSVDAWLALMLRWIEEDCDRALADEQRHRDALPADASILFLAGGEHVIRAKTDIAALQRLAEDLLRCDPAERGALKSAPHALPPSLDGSWGRILKACGEPEVEALLVAALEDRWDGAAVAHQVWKYSGASAENRIGAVLKAWHGRGGGGAGGLLEVLHYRQGSVFCSPDASDRFQEAFAAFEPPADRGEAFAAAQEVVSGWVDDWTYEHQDTLAECFANRKYDCFNVGSALACLLANRGFDGIYPVMQVSERRHVQTAMRVGERLVIRDGAGPGGESWPAGWVSGGMRLGILWRRTVDSWVDAEILDCGAKTLTRRRVPYAGVAEEATAPLPE